MGYMCMLLAGISLVLAVHSAALTEEERSDIRSLLTQLIAKGEEVEEIEGEDDMLVGGGPVSRDVPDTKIPAMKRGDDGNNFHGFFQGYQREELPEMKRDDADMAKNIGFFIDPKREELKRDVDSSGPYDIKMCYYCDPSCRSAVGGSMAAYIDYLNQVSAGIQDRIRTLTGDATTVVSHGQVSFPIPRNTVLIFKSKTFSRTGLDLLAHIAGNIWTQWPVAQIGGQYLNDFLNDNGCTFNFLLVAREDNLWLPENSAGVSGMAPMMGLCAGRAYGLVKLKDDPEEMATLISHEIGHIMGMSHDDGSLDPDWDSQCRRMDSFAPCAALKTQCKKPASGCADGTGGCIMAATVGTNAAFSECSKAYWEGFKALTHPQIRYTSVRCIKRQ